MKLENIRFAHGQHSTLGWLRINDQDAGFVLEDEGRAHKVKGETRIPAGTYAVALRQVISPLTERYRARFPDFFEWHLEIQHVPNFSHVYIHVGNTEDDTEGCLLVGNGAVYGAHLKVHTITESVAAYTRIYKQIVAAMKAGERVTITLREI